MNTNPPARPASRPPGRPAVPPIRPFTPEQKARLSNAINTITSRIRDTFRALRPVVAAAARAIRQLATTLRTAARPQPDRPAWASPYGPPARPTRK